MERVWWNRGGIKIKGINTGQRSTQRLATVLSCYCPNNCRAMGGNGVTRLPDRLRRSTALPNLIPFTLWYSARICHQYTQSRGHGRLEGADHRGQTLREQSREGMGVDWVWWAQRVTVNLRRHGKLFSQCARVCPFQTNIQYPKNMILMIAKIDWHSFRDFW